MTTKTQHPSSRAQRAHAAPVLLAIASGKGGVGKTWFSISLSHALAQQGKRVLLFDGDLGLANVDVQLGLMAKRDLNDVIDSDLDLSRVIEHHEEGGFDVVAGRSGQAVLSNMPLARLNELVQQMRAMKQYDVVIIDLGAGIDRTVRFMAAASDMTLVVTTDEPTALTDAYVFIKLGHQSGHSDNMQVVVNMTGSLKEGETTYNTLLKACKSFLQIAPPLMGLIRQDKRVRDAIRAQTLYLIRTPASETAEDVERVAARVMDEILR